MGLVYWLPMTNGELKNQGLSDAQPTNSGATVNNNGKLGKCYNFDGSSHIDTGYKQSFGTGDFTLSAWFKLTKTNGKTYQMIVGAKNSSATNVGCGIYWNQTQQKFLWSTANGTTSQEKWMATALEDSFIYNTWHHIAMVRNSSDAKIGYFYIDGTRYELATVPTAVDVTNTTNNMLIGCNASLGATYRWTGSICDIRIYDHALSAREIKELSKGLVAHYTLGRGGFGQDNLISSLVAGGRTTISNGVITAAFSQDKDTYFNFKCSENLVAGENYTLSFYCSGFQSSENYVDFDIISQNSGKNITAKNGLCTATFSPDSNIISGNNVILDDRSRVHTGYTDVKLEYIKLEKGSIATPWTPNSSDALYTAMGLNDNTVYDVSGYGYNLTLTSGVPAISYSSDTARYSISTVFGGGAYFTGNSLPAETQSVSFWIKATYPSSNGVVFADYGSKIGFGFWPSGTGFIVHTGASNGSTGSSVVKGGYYNNSDWNHVVIIKTGTGTYTVYLNGNQLSSGANQYWTHSTDNLMIGRRSAGTGFTGQLSDFRAYATQLSEDDIMELYQVGASLANNGVLMAQGEIVES